MVFSSLQFIFIFLPIFFAVYFLLPDPRKNLVLLAGKGHETYQEIGGEFFHLDEREEVAAFFHSPALCGIM